MMGKWSNAAALALLVSASANAAEPPPLQIGAIGDLTLESGAVLRDAKLGYRTEGTLNAERRALQRDLVPDVVHRYDGAPLRGRSGRDDRTRLGSS